METKHFNSSRDSLCGLFMRLDLLIHIFWLCKSIA